MTLASVRIGVAVFVLKGEKVLLGKRKGAHGAGLWATPGGHLELGETVEACAKRELEEETGLKALSIKMGPWTENFLEEGKKHYITFFVFATEIAGEVQLLEPDKCEGWEWFEWTDLPSPLFPTLALAIEKINDQNNSSHL